MNGDRTIMVEILNAIEYGNLSVDETRRRLERLIDIEIEKTDAPANKLLVEECEKLLWELNTNGKLPFVSHLEENQSAVLRNFRNHQNLRMFGKYALRIGIVAAALFVFAIGAEVLLHREWLDTTTSSDGEQLIIAGEVYDPGLVNQGNAADNEDSDQLTTSNRNELLSFIGNAFSIPEELPGNWKAALYFCSKTNELINTNTLYYKSTDDDNALTLGILWFRNIQDTYVTFEQNNQGEHISYNGLDLYVTQNIDDSVFIWSKNDNMYILSGIISLTEALPIIDFLIGG